MFLRIVLLSMLVSVFTIQASSIQPIQEVVQTAPPQESHRQPIQESFHTETKNSLLILFYCKENLERIIAKKPQDYFIKNNSQLMIHIIRQLNPSNPIFQYKPETQPLVFQRDLESKQDFLAFASLLLEKTNSMIENYISFDKIRDQIEKDVSEYNNRKHNKNDLDEWPAELSGLSKRLTPTLRKQKLTMSFDMQARPILLQSPEKILQNIYVKIFPFYKDSYIIKSLDVFSKSVYPLICGWKGYEIFKKSVCREICSIISKAIEKIQGKPECNNENSQ